jgi:hypothetical protein
MRFQKRHLYWILTGPFFAVRWQMKKGVGSPILFPLFAIGFNDTGGYLDLQISRQMFE